MVIASAGFGQTSPWNADVSATVPKGHVFTFRGALFTALETIYWRLLEPAWLGRLLSRIPSVPYMSERHALTATSWSDLNSWFGEMVGSAKADYDVGSLKEKSNVDVSSNKGALLRRMVHANIAEGTDQKLSDDELLANALVRYSYISDM